jgi:hypothetical protein
MKTTLIVSLILVPFAFADKFDIPETEYYTYDVSIQRDIEPLQSYEPMNSKLARDFDVGSYGGVVVSIDSVIVQDTGCVNRTPRIKDCEDDDNTTTQIWSDNRWRHNNDNRTSRIKDSRHYSHHRDTHYQVTIALDYSTENYPYTIKFITTRTNFRRGDFVIINVEDNMPNIKTFTAIYNVCPKNFYAEKGETNWWNRRNRLLEQFSDSYNHSERNE